MKLYKITRAFTLLLLVLLLLLMGGATLIEHRMGSDYVTDHIYHSPWFILLWALLVLLSVASFVRFKLWRRFSVLLLHLSFIVILAGALTTYVTSHKGVVHLVPGVATQQFSSDDLRQHYALPFGLKLDSFSVVTYPGTEAPADYVSHVTLLPTAPAAPRRERISMNRILSYEGYRFYQSSYDSTGGSWLTVNYDPYGTALTYMGYVMLLVSMCLVVGQRSEEFRRLLRHPLLRKGAFGVALFMGVGLNAQAQRQLPAFSRAKADSLAKRQVIYNDRVAPFNTLARDFVLKLYGSADYHGLSAEQVVSGWLLRPDVWQNEPMIRVKSAELRRLLRLDGDYARLTDLFDNQHQYVLQRYWQGDVARTAPQTDPLQSAIAELDEKVGLILMLQKGTLIRPLPTDGSVAPLSAQRVEAELLYNRLPLTRVLFLLCLVLGGVAFGRTVYAYMHAPSQLNRFDRYVLPAGLYLLTVALGWAYVLRWYVARYIPLSNGYETMQFMALATLVVACFLHRRFRILLPLGLVLSGLALLVSYLGQGNPQVTQLMPVLASPWLSLHVSVIMMGYTLLGFIFLTSVLGLCVKGQAERMMLFGRLLLYPAVFLLGIGIFLGAIWANQSWGAYWSWDPKETWALITLMVYAFAFHAQSLPWFGVPRHFHWFCVLALLSVLMTYFGVNFVLGGMHSYA